MGWGVGGGSSTATYVLVTATGALVNARTLAAGAGISFVDGGAGSTFTIAASIAENIAITDLTDVAAKSGSGTTVLFQGSPTITTPTITGAIAFEDGVRQTFNPDGTNAGINVGAVAGDPSTPSNGDLWYDSTANELTARINGANVTLGAGSTAFPILTFYPDQLETSNNANWIVNALAPTGADSLNNALTNAAFDDTAEEGRGFTVRIPSTATNMIVNFISRCQTAPAAARTVGVKLYYRQIKDTTAISTTWAGTNDGSKVLTDIDITTNTNPVYDTQTLHLVNDLAPDILAGSTYQFELTRINPVGGTELVGDWDLLELQVTFS